MKRQRKRKKAKEKAKEKKKTRKREGYLYLEVVARFSTSKRDAEPCP